MTMIAGKPQVRLRALEPEDLDILYRYENDSSLWEVGTTIAPFSRKQLYDYIAGYSNDIYAERQLRLMVDDAATGETVGTVDITDFSPADMRAQAGILIGPGHQRRGYGTAALGQCAVTVGRHCSCISFMRMCRPTMRRVWHCSGNADSGLPAVCAHGCDVGELSRRDSAAANVRLMRQPTFRLRRTF